MTHHAEWCGDVKMNKSTLAVCMVLVMVGMAVTVAATASDTNGEELRKFDHKLYLTNEDNLDTVIFAGESYTYVNAATANEYEDQSFPFNRLIIDMEVVPAHAFDNASTSEILLTEKVRKIEEYAFYSIDYLLTVGKVGTTPVSIDKYAFGSCTRLGVVDLRTHGTIDPLAFGNACTAKFVVDEQSDVPDCPNAGLVFLSKDVEEVSYIRNDRDYNGVDRIQVEYYGYGLLHAYDYNNQATTYTHREDYFADEYNFDRISGGNMYIDYLKVDVTYGGFGLGSERIAITAHEMPLKTPAPGSIDGTFNGWKDTRTGTDLGLGLDRDEIESTKNLIYDLEPVMEPFSVTYDATDIPSTEERKTFKTTTYGYGGHYPSQVETEHYVLAAWVVVDDGTVTTHLPGSEITRYRDHTAKAVWNAKPEFTYTASYLDVSGSVIGTVSIGHGKVLDIDDRKPTDETPTQMLDGWKVDGSGKVLYPGDSVTVVKDISLVPVLKDRVQYNVKFSNGTETVATQTAREGVPYVIDVPEPTSPDSIFTGWSYGQAVLHNGDTIDVTGDIVLNAQWRDRAQYTVTFKVDSTDYAQGTAKEGIPFTISSEDPFDKTRMFLGWTAPDGSKGLFCGDSLEVDGHITLTAEWRDRAQYTVTFKDGSTTITTADATEGIPFVVGVSDMPDGERIFMGWEVEDGKLLQKGDAIDIGSDTVLDAQWRDRTEYKVTFMNGDSEVGTATAYEGLDFVISIEDLPDGERIFMGWEVEDGKLLQKGDVIDVNRDIVINAEWRDRETYEVRFMDGQTVLATETATEGIPFSIDQPAPTDEDMIFMGWEVDGKLLQQGSLTITEDIDITASWRDRETYTVSFVSHGTTISTDEATEGIPYEMTREDLPHGTMVFVGWTLNGGPVRNGDMLNIDRDTSIIAKWRDRETYEVTYRDGSTDLLTTRVTEGNDLTIDAPKVEDGVRIFVGWHIQGVDGILMDGDTVRISGNTVIHTEWRDREVYRVVFMDGTEIISEDTATEGVPFVSGQPALPDGERMFVHWAMDGDRLKDGTILTSDTRVDAVWRDRETYTVTYTGGTQTIERTATEGIPFIHDEEALPDGERVFLGWRMTGSDGYLAEGTEITVTGDMTIDAVWRDRFEYTVRYLDGAASIMETKVIEGDMLTLTETIPEDEDRIFVGWALTEDGVRISEKEIAIDGDTDIHSLWRMKSGFAVTFLDDGEVCYERTVKEGNEFLIDVGDLPDDERIFVGWSISGDEGVLDKDLPLTITGDTTIDAVWRDRAVYGVTFVNGEDTIGTATAREGIPFVIPIDDPADGTRMFLGWKIGSDDTLYRNGDELSIDAEASLSAVWRDRVEYTVTFMNGTSEVGKLKAYEGIDAMVSVEDLADDERIFVGWQSESGDGYRNGDKLTVSGNMVLKAVWRDRAVYSVTYMNGGETLGKETAREGIPYEIGMRDLTDDDRVFVGWRVPNTDQVHRFGDSFVATGDVVLVAEWRDRLQLSVVYVSENRIVGSVTVTEGGTIQVGWDVSAQGKELVGWNDGTMSIVDRTEYVVNENVTFTAIWSDSVMNTVTYMLPSGPLTASFVEGQTVKVSAEAGTRDGMVFAGWSLSKDGAPAYRNGDHLVISGDVTLYPVWEPADPAVDDDPDGSQEPSDEDHWTFLGMDSMTTSIAVVAGVSALIVSLMVTAFRRS